jgi:MFS family permease
MAMVAVVLACYFATQIDHTVALIAIICCNALFYFGGGVTTLSFQDVVAKIIPANTRGRFFGMRQLCGGLLAFLIGGPLVRWLLSDASPFAFPYNFAVISLFSLCCYALAMSAFATVVEPRAPQVVPAIPLREALRAAPQMLRNNPLYRRFIWARLWLLVGRLAEPFYIIYITEQLHLPNSTSGALIAAGAVAAALSNMIWGRLGDKRGMQWLLSFTGGISVLPPLMMMAAPLLLSFGTYAILAWVLLISLLVGMSSDGTGIAGMTFLLEVAPPEQRPLYMGLANTLLGIGAIIPIIGGLLITQLGYTGTYAIAAVSCTLGAVIAFQLRTVRTTQVQ